MRNFTLLVFLLLANLAQATNYYFSAQSGDDSRTAQQASNSATPWKTLDKLTAFQPSLKPGDSIFFKRGEIYYGTANLNKAGTSLAPIYYGAYGTGAAPLMSGFTTLTGWTLHSGSVYYTTLDAPYINIVTLNGVAKGMGRYPNTGYLNYETHVANSSITDNQLAASPNWSGGEIVMRKYRFILDRHTITSHVGTTLNYSTGGNSGNNSAFSPVNGNGYFIQNHLSTLDQQGEWYYDPAAKRLYMHFGSSAAASVVVKASAKDYNFLVTTTSNIVIENLDFEGGNNKGLWLNSASNILVQNCNFYNQGSSAIYGVDLSSVTIKGGTVNTSFSNGVNLEKNVNGATVDGVSVYNSNTIPGTGKSGSGASIGISVTGDNSTIINNKVIKSGYSGIQFLGNNVLVERNYIDTFCTLKDDGGGVYTFEGAANETSFNRKIKNNVILNAIGSFAGAESYYYEAFGKGAGIYLDEFVNNIEISGNTIANGDWAGIFMHNAHDCQMTNNIIYNHRYQMHVSQYTPATRNMVHTGNQYVSKQAFQEVWYYRTFVADNPSTMGTSNNNYFARPIDDNKTVHIDYLQSGGVGAQYYTLAQWRTNFTLDAVSQKSPLTYTANINDSIRFDYNETATPKLVTLNASYIDIKGTPYAGSFVLQPYTSVVLLKNRTAFKLNQVITFPPISDKTFGVAPIALTATSTSGLPVSYRVVSGPATVASNTLTLTGAGTVTIEASQAGDATYNAAPVVTQSFVAYGAKAAQTISFPAVGGQTYGVLPFALAATATSGLPVSYKTVSGPASVSGNVLIINSAGTVIIEASQAGNLAYNAAAPVSQSFVVAKATQSISFPALLNKTTAETPFNLYATASSGLPVAYRVVSGPATVAGSAVNLTGFGTVVIEASQPGDVNFTAAPAITQSFEVYSAVKINQTISFPAITGKTFADGPFNPGATASSGLPVSYRIISGPATVAGGLLTPTGVGSVVIEASQSGDNNYNGAPVVSQSFYLAGGNQTITFPTIATQTMGTTPSTLAATASSGLPVSYKILSGPATVTGNLMNFTGSGQVWIEASQAGNANYNPAPSVSQAFFIGKGAQVITFPSIPAKTTTDAPFNLTATASSGLPVGYVVSSGPATVVGNKLTLTGVSGTVWIEASQAGDANYNAAASTSQSFFVAVSTAKSNQTISFPAIADRPFTTVPFNLSATASSGLPVSFKLLSGPAMIAGNAVTVTGIGTVIIEASQAGNTNFNAAASTSQSFVVSKAAQTINFPVPANRIYGDVPFALAATATSGLPVSYRVVAGPATVSGNTVSITGVGLVTIEASQPGDSNYTIAPATSQVFTVDKAPQTLTFPAIGDKVFGVAPFAIAASSSSGLPVSFKVLAGPATIVGNQVTITGTGNVTIEASQAGNDNYNPAASTSQTFAATTSTVKQAQTITFGTLGYKTYGAAPFTLSATASSGLPVSFKVVTGSATVVGTTVTLTGAGNVTIEANQGGDGNYNAAPPVQRSFTVGKASQTITFPTPPNKTFGDAPFNLTATTSSGLLVSYRVVSGPATVTGNLVTLTGSGLVFIEASQGGDANYNAATALQRNFTVTAASSGVPLAQIITFPAIADKTFGDAAFALTATSSSGLTVSYRIVSGPASVAGNQLQVTGVGPVTVEASQVGNASFAPALPVTQSFNVVKASQTIAFAPLGNKTTNDSPFILGAMASSGLPVSYRLVSGPATLSGNTVTLTGIGTVVIEATQAGDGNYNPAVAVQQSFAVTAGAVKQSQTITFGTLGYKTYGAVPFSLNATASSSLPVSFKIVSGPATITGTTVTVTGVGNVTIEASQAGDANYNPAPAVQRSFTVGKAGQTISFTAPGNKVYGAAPFALTATASSGLAVAYRIVSGPAAVTGNLVTLTGVGTVTIEASQAGDGNYTAALAVQRSFTVSAPTTLVSNTSTKQVVIETVSQQNNLAIYPNPIAGNGTIKVQLAQATRGMLEILNLQGKVVQRLEEKSFLKGKEMNVAIDVKGLSSGAYFLRLVTGHGVVVRQFQILK